MLGVIVVCSFSKCMLSVVSSIKRAIYRTGGAMNPHERMDTIMELHDKIVPHDHDGALSV